MFLAEHVLCDPGSRIIPLKQCALKATATSVPPAQPQLKDQTGDHPKRPPNATLPCNRHKRETQFQPMIPSAATRWPCSSETRRPMTPFPPTPKSSFALRGNALPGVDRVGMLKRSRIVESSKARLARRSPSRLGDMLVVCDAHRLRKNKAERE